MAIYLLEGYNTDSRYSSDVRYREYTNSKKRAELFNKIPKIQFSDSGHGICFSTTKHKGYRKPQRGELSAYVFEQMAKLTLPKAVKPKCPSCNCSKGNNRFCQYCGTQLKDFHLNFKP